MSCFESAVWPFSAFDIWELWTDHHEWTFGEINLVSASFYSIVLFSPRDVFYVINVSKSLINDEDIINDFTVQSSVPHRIIDGEL